MAKLLGQTRDHKTAKLIDATLEISPIAPTLTGLRDAYRISVGPNAEGHVFDATLTVMDGHYGVQFAAEMFSRLSELLDLPKNRYSHLAFHNSVGWADFFVTATAGLAKPPRARVEVYVFDQPQDYDIERGFFGDRCAAFHLHASVDEVAAFGDDLMRELIAAWQKRLDLGLSVGDEAKEWPEYFRNDPKWSRYFSST